jgi:hypothetical protein
MGKKSLARNWYRDTKAHNVSSRPQENSGRATGEVGEGKARKKMK